MRTRDLITPFDRVAAVPVAAIIVPLDGSAFAELALRPACALSQRFRSDLRLLGVGANASDAGRVRRYLEPVADVLNARCEIPVGPPAKTILDVVGAHAGPLLCMSSHGHGHGQGRLGEVLLGSVATSILAGAVTPVLVVGPRYEPKRSLTAGPVLACLDGSLASEALLPVAASWAAALGVALGLATVAEPVPALVDDRPYRRLQGPDVDPETYVNQVAVKWQGVAGRILPVAIYDPLGPAQGLSRYLEHADAGLVAVNSQGCAGLAPVVLGSDVAHIVSLSPVPVLVVPRKEDRGETPSSDDRPRRAHGPCRQASLLTAKEPV